MSRKWLLQLLSTIALLVRLSTCSQWPYLQVYPPVNETDERTPLHFALVLSFGSNVTYKSIGALPGVQIALDYINSEPSILPGYTLHYTLTDSQCNHQAALSSYFNQLKNPPTKVGWIGSGCSPATEPTAELTQLYNITQLSCVSSSPELHNRQRFRYYFQLLASDVLSANGFYGIIQHFGWKRVRLVSQDENIFTTTIDALKQMLDRADIEYSEVTFKTDEGFQSVKAFDADTRIYVLVMYSPHTRDAFCEAYRRGLHYPKYVFITFGWYVKQWWEVDSTTNNCTAEERGRVVLYSLAALSSQFPREHDEYTAEPNIKLSEFRELYYEALTRNSVLHKYLEEYSKDIFPYAYQCNEATLTLAYALNQTIGDFAENETLNRVATEQSGLSEGDNFTMANFTYATSVVVSQMVEILHNTRFPGISGNDVKFNDQGTRDIDQVRILQYQLNNSESKEILRAEVGAVVNVGRNSTFQSHNDSFVFPDGIPGDGIPIFEVVTVSLGLTVVYVTLAIAGVTFAIGCLLFTIKFRDKKLIRLSSPNLNYIIGLGAIVLYLNVIVLVIPTTNKTFAAVLCNINPWLISLGYSLCYGIITIKMIRVWVIFNRPLGFKAPLFRDILMIFFVVCLTIIDIVILVVYTVTEAVRDNLGVKLTPNQELPEEIFGATAEHHKYFLYVCESEGQVILYAVLFGYKGLLQAIALLLAFRTRNVKVKGLDDSVYIAASIYVTSIVLAVIIVSTYTLTDYVNTYPAVVGMGLLLGTTVILGLVFIPRMVGLYKDPKGETITTMGTQVVKDEIVSEQAMASATELNKLRHRIVELEATLKKHTSLVPPESSTELTEGNFSPSKSSEKSYNDDSAL